LNVTEAVDRLIRYFDNVNTSDGGYGNRATRTLVYLQQVYDDAENFREWQWRITTHSDTIVAPASTFPLPADYATLGRSGGVAMRVSTSDPWDTVDEDAPELVAYQIEQQTSAVSFPDIFAIYSGVVNFPYAGTDLLYKIRYLKVPKTLQYGLGTPDTFDIPAPYHNSVLLAGTIARMARGKGDAREDWLKQYRQGLTDMVSRERSPESEARQMPEAVPPMC